MGRSYARRAHSFQSLHISLGRKNGHSHRNWQFVKLSQDPNATGMDLDIGPLKGKRDAISNVISFCSAWKSELNAVKAKGNVENPSQNYSKTCSHDKGHG